MKMSFSQEALNELIPEGCGFEAIGIGGFKVVYSASINGHKQAVKIAHIPHSDDDEDSDNEHLKRIKREIGILRRCTVPELVKLGDIEPREAHFQNENYIIYSEELLSGKSLRDVIQDGHSPNYSELVALATCLFNAITELSGLGVIHRDIKPANVMATGDSKRPFVLIDLGIAFQRGGTVFTRNAFAIPGTLYYLAPEMLDDNFRSNLDSRADVYTAALTVYEYAAGQNPFAVSHESQFDTMYRIKKVVPMKLSKIRNDLPVEFCNIIDQCLKKIPALRPANTISLAKRILEIG